jgi:hypothetical protein
MLDLHTPQTGTMASKAAINYVIAKDFNIKIPVICKIFIQISALIDLR